jgi:hypothetical protein
MGGLALGKPASVRKNGLVGVVAWAFGTGFIPIPSTILFKNKRDGVEGCAVVHGDNWLSGWDAGFHSDSAGWASLSGRWWKTIWENGAGMPFFSHRNYGEKVSKTPSVTERCPIPGIHRVRRNLIPE